MSGTSPAEWAAAGSLGVSAISLIGLAMAFADADLAYFDPRPAAARVVASRPACWVLNEVSKAHADVRELAGEARLYAALSLRETAVSAAALLALLVPAHSESVR